MANEMNAKNIRDRILLVDDEKDILVVLSRRLESWGYEVLTAASGKEGLQVAESGRPNLILLDIVMPEMKGREVCARLKANPLTRGIPVIFLTALGMPEQIEAGIAAGVDDYIVKPFEPKDMKDRIKDCLLRDGRLSSSFELTGEGLAPVQQ